MTNDVRKNIKQVGRNISRVVLPKSVENWFIGSKEDEEFLKKNINAVSYDESKRQYKEGKITKEQFIKQIKIRERVDRIKADNEYRDVRNKNIGQSVIDIGTAAIPIGGGAKITGKIIKGLTPKLGKKISTSVVNGTMDGIKMGAAHGVLSGVVNEDINPITQGAVEGVTGGVIGGVAGAGVGKVVKKLDGKELKQAPKKDKIKLAKNYYSNYERGIDVVNENLGKIKMASDAYKETLKQNIKFADKAIDLSEDLKTAKYIQTELPKHDHKKYDIVKFHRLRGKNTDYLISENSRGDYYFYKVTDSELSGPKPGLQSLSTSSIPNQSNNLNPAKVLDNVLNDKNVQQGGKEVLTKGSQIGVYKKLEEKDNGENDNLIKGYSDNGLLNFDGISLDGVKWDDWSEDMKKDFMEGFESNSYNDGEKRNKSNWTDKFNIGDPNIDNGHWITLDNGKHLFIKNKY